MMIQEFKRESVPTYATIKGGRGFVTSFFASGRAEKEAYKDYDVNAAKKYLKKHEDQTEAVDVMFRNSQRYASSMSAKRYKLIAAICIVQGVQYVGCDVWNEKLADAMMHFKRVCSNEMETVGSTFDEKKAEQRRQKIHKIIEEYLDEVIVDDYTYEIHSNTEDGLIEVLISNEEDEEFEKIELSYVIDPYVIHGNDIYLMDSKGTAIPFFKEDMISAIIYGKKMFESDWNDAAEYEFHDKELYNVFDLSNCKKLEKLGVAEYHAFENKLLVVKEELQKRYAVVPRCRIVKFAAEDEFSLVSDRHVNNNRYYRGQVLEGKVIRVDCFLNQIQISEG